MMISFDVIWIPAGLTLLAMGWAFLMLRNFGSSGLGIIEELTIGLFLPAIPVLSAWLVWALLT